jgi:hypothetical protein
MLSFVQRGSNSHRVLMARARSLVLGLGLGLACAAPLHAEPSAAQIETAKRMFAEAAELEASEQWDQAILKLRQALTIKETPGLRFHLAYCEEQLGHLQTALIQYDRASELFLLGNAAPDVAERIDPARASLRERIPTLELQILPKNAEASVRLDGIELSGEALTRPVPLDPGGHTLDVVADGFRDWTLKLQLKERDRKKVSVKLLSLSGQPPAEPSAAPRADEPAKRTQPISAGKGEIDSSGMSLRTGVLLGELGLTVAGVAVGVIFTQQASSTDDRIEQLQADIDRRAIEAGVEPENACSSPSAEIGSACDELGRSFTDRDDQSTLGIVGFVGGGLAAAALVTTYFAWPAESPPARLSAMPTRRGVFTNLQIDF